MKVTEIEVVSYSPLVGEEGIEGAFLRTRNGNEVYLITGPAVVTMLAGTSDAKPRRVYRKRDRSNSATSSLKCVCGRTLESPQGRAAHQRHCESFKKEARMHKENMR